MESSNKSKGSESLNDVMYRRLKNRERQRRYRERKRLQADASKPHGTSSPSDPSQWQIVSLPNNGVIDQQPSNGMIDQQPNNSMIDQQPNNAMIDQQVVTRIHCPRDWKKDARRAHLAKQKATPNGHSLNGENHGTEQTLKSEVPATNGAQLNDSDILRSKPGRRAWKAEARKKQEVA